ncbi:hypothetical protein DF185_22640 [Marinifilum breve]|uniref:Uncharacterized protein n=2 Tax=Marinifilum breve TaxID=2184082 RepID=A0A2V3ZR48_9BACT|nr:hypothetical protein DF185_22640 [Marinifilum breve]
MLAIWNGKLMGQNTGPAAPEAMSFEPIDATDMVNLLSGDFSYVLPLIHVPGPGGGFSMPISYHGGIAMDQEASWVGLGWNINPGSINRSVNGFADDALLTPTVAIRTKKSQEYVTHRVDAGINYSGISAGISFSWGDNRSIGGHYGLGYGNAEIGVSARYSFSSGKTSVGVSASYNEIGARISNSGIGVSAGPLSVNYDSYGLNAGVSLSAIGVSFSSGGIGVNALGVGFSIVEKNAGSDNDIRKFSKDLLIPLYTPWFSVSYSRSKFYYKFYKRDHYETCGLLHTPSGYSDKVEDGVTVQNMYRLMDVYSLMDNSFDSTSDKNSRNSNEFSAHDNYRINSQGLNGTMTSKVMNGALIAGQGVDLNYDGNDLIEYTRFKTTINQNLRMHDDLFFSLDNGYDALTRVKFNQSLYLSDGLNENYFEKEISNNSKINRRGGKDYVTYYTNREIVENFELVTSKGFIETEDIDRNEKTSSDVEVEDIQVVTLNGGTIPIGNLTSINSEKLDLDGIGAYSIVASDGKTYHYSLPVYQFESIRRKNYNSDGDFEEYQDLGKYATSWLLTAITGPDFIDNGNGKLDNGDKGYWVRFTYGKWTDGYIWSYPYDFGSKDYSTYDGDINWGRKQIYYLNSISTKTHTAHFVKDFREDALSKKITYNRFDEYGKSYKLYYPGLGVIIVTPSSKIEYNTPDKIKPLKLSKIVLAKNSDSENVSSKKHRLTRVNSDISKISSKSFYSGGKKEILYASNFTANESENVLDHNDMVDFNFDDALQIIDFNYDYSLCANTPNSNADNKGKLTLKSIHVKGKGGENILPPYLFEYHENGQFNSDLKDIWGYYESDPKAWSLKSITTPLGAKIEVDYEEDSYNREVVRNEKIKYELNNYSFNYSEISASEINVNKVIIELEGDIDLNSAFKVGDRYGIYLKLGLHYLEHDDVWEGQGSYNVDEKLINTSSELLLISNNKLIFRLNERYDVPSGSRYDFKGVDSEKIEEGYIIGKNAHYQGEGGGLRVATLNLVDENGESFKTKYTYNIPGTNTSSGVTIYAPVDDGNKYCDYIPFKSELPTPAVIYEYVTVEECGKNETSDLTTEYQFEVYDQVIQSSNSYKIGEQFQFTDVQGNSYSSERKSIFISNFGSIGRLLKKSLYNNKGDLLNKTINQFKSLSNINYGLSQETFVSDKIYKKKVNGSWTEKRFLNTTSKISYPSVLNKIVTIENGLTSEQINLEWDKKTGKVTKVKSVNPKGEEYISEVIPAYTKYSAMGSKILDSSNKNMLSQETANYQYKLVNGVPKLLSAGIQTWEDDWVYRKPTMMGTYEDEPITGIWRKHENFVLTAQRDDKGLINNWIDFNWLWNEEQAEANNWIKTNEITRYNEYSAPLESKDINGNYISTQYDKSGLNVIASVSNARWKEKAYTGFEQYQKIGTVSSFEGEISSSGSNVIAMASESLLADERNGLSAVSGIQAHTGNQYLKMVGTNIINLPERIAANPSKPNDFVLSCWIHKKSASSAKFKVRYAMQTMSGTVYNEKSGGDKIQFGDWILMTYHFYLPSTSASFSDVQIATNSSSDVVYLDDFRLHPLNASMNSYVYDNHTDELIAILDNENIATKYFYDEAGNLEKIEKETPDGFKKVSEYDNYYANQVNAVVPSISGFSLSMIHDSRDFGGMQVKLNHTVNTTPTEYCISIDDSNFTNCSWRSYSGNITTYLPLGDHRVYFKVRNILSQESNVVSANINNYFSVSLNKSNYYTGDRISGTCYFNSSYTRNKNFKVYKNGVFIKQVYPTFTNDGPSGELLRPDYLEGNSTSQSFDFSSSGLSLGDYELRVIDVMDQSFYKTDRFSIVSRPPSPSCTGRYDANTNMLTASWSNFGCNEVYIYLNGNLLGTYSGSGGSGMQQIRVLSHMINTGGVEDPREPMRMEEERIIEEELSGPEGPGTNILLVRCVSGSTSAETLVLVLSEML